MASELVPRIDRQGIAGRPVSRRARREVDRVADDGLVDGARIIARAYVAHVALVNLDLVTNEEARFVARHPMVEHRFRAIGDAFANYAARQTAGLGF